MNTTSPELIAETGTCRYIRTRGITGWPVQIAVKAEGQQYDHEGRHLWTRWVALEGNGWVIAAGDPVSVNEGNVVPLVRVNWHRVG